VKPWIRNCAIVLSHAWVGLVAFTGFNAYQTQAEIDRSRTDPVYRVGLRLSAPPAPDGPRQIPIEKELEAVAKANGPLTAGVLRLLWHLRRGEPAAAGSACQALGWAHCDPGSLAEMRKLVGE
jgi:hypothetical protein